MKDTFFINLIQKDAKIADKEVLEILSNEKYRSVFINEYSYFYEHDLSEIHNFIERNLNDFSETSLRIDLLDLSCIVNYFNELFFKTAVSDLKSSKNYLLKLSVLDYMNNFFYRNEVKSNYYEINFFLVKKSYNKLVVFQAMVNLLLFDEDLYKKKVLEKLRKKNTESSFYYRLVNTFVDFPQFETINHILTEFSDLVKESHLVVAQKDELLKIIKMYNSKKHNI